MRRILDRFQQTFTHPLVASRFLNLVGLAWHHGCDLKFAPRMLCLMLLALARQPIAWAAEAKYGRRTARQPIEPAPIFIVGHWRSGTTHLQNLMSQDPQFGRVTLLQAALPYEFLMLPVSTRERIGRMLPATRLMDNVPIAADVPWEEELALTAVGRLSFYHVSFFPRRMGRIFNEAVLFDGGNPRLIARWKRQYLHFLRKVQFTQPGKRLLLKNPANTARIKWLRDMFPGARFIHLHRNPYKVFASSVHLYLKAQEAWGLQSTNRAGVVDHVLDSYPRLMNEFFEQQKGLRSDEWVEIDFRSVQENPIQTLAGVYRQLNLQGFDAAVPCFERYLESQRHYRKNQLPLSEADRIAVASRWKDVFTRLGYTV